MEELRKFCETGIISASRMRAVDENARYRGVSELQLMESAGSGLAELVRRCYKPERVLVLCGKGNNGGDGFVAARHLQSSAHVDVISTSGGMPGSLASMQLAALRHCAVSLYNVSCDSDVDSLQFLFERADVIIDAMLGTGVLGIPRQPVRRCIEYANASPAPIVSADVPTPGIVPEIIGAFHRPKVAGSRIIDIGIPSAAECFVGPGDLKIVPIKDTGAHKGVGGEVLVIGGGPYQGAPYLAGLAALRSGADLVRIASPVILPCPDLIVSHLPGEIVSEEHTELLIKLAGRADAVVCGNGLGKNSHAVVRDVAPYCKRCVFDADALALPLPEAPDTIYTPHAGEFERMFGSSLPEPLGERGEAIRNYAKKATLLVKGQVDVISDGERVRFNDTGTPAMTVGGTGDILAGVCGALFCRLPAFEAACIAAFVTGSAGDACIDRGDGLLATDLLDHIPPLLFGRSM